MELSHKSPIRRYSFRVLGLSGRLQTVSFNRIAAQQMFIRHASLHSQPLSLIRRGWCPGPKKCKRQSIDTITLRKKDESKKGMYAKKKKRKEKKKNNA